ncbi:MAG TPA: hypothetical protein PKN36_08890 [bacterium]|nr:hypothetical protein [bacterium]
MKAKSPIAGAILGIITFSIFGIIDRLFSRGSTFLGSGWGHMLLGAVILGAIVGAVVAMVVDKTRNKGVGIISGAILVSLIHGFGVTMFGLRGGFRIFAMLWGAIYGAIASIVIASSILQAIEKESGEEQ